MDASTIIVNLLPALNAASTGDLIWWTPDDLYGYANEAKDRLTRVTGACRQVDAGTFATGECPTGAALATIHAAWNGVSLRSATVRELEALDAGWLNAKGTPRKWTQDLTLTQIRVYPAPSMAGTLERVATVIPPTITAGSPTLAAPIAVASYFYAAMLAAARRGEGEAQLLDVAQHLDSRLKFLEQVFRAYYGGAA